MNREEAESETPGQEEAWPHEVDLLHPHAEKLEEEEEKEEEEEQEEQKEQEYVGVSVEQQLQQAIAQLRMEMEEQIGDRWSCSGESLLLVVVVSPQQTTVLTCIIPDSRKQKGSRACGSSRLDRGLHTPPGGRCENYNL